MAALAADPPPPPADPASPPPPVISSHQIDRYDAISQLQDKLKANPKSLADWVILGELAHEVALDSAPDQAAKYNQMSLDAYEKALALAPDNPGLKAAVQFARDQQTNQGRLDQTRDQATQTYLDARRRDLADTNYTPTVRVSTPALPARTLPADPGVPANQVAPAPAPVQVAPNPAPVVTSAPPYSAYSYQPLYTPGTTAPYTFNQYSSAYYPANYYTPGVAPVSAQRYMQQSLMNTAGQQIFRGIAPRR
jgi:hypothetical protein